MKVYKQTNQDFFTRKDTNWWKWGVEHTAPGGGPLCTDKWLHAYKHPLQAALFNPIHRRDEHPRLFECDADVGVDDGTKLGCTRIRRGREVPYPTPTPEQLVRMAIYLAQEICSDAWFQGWAQDWLSGADRSLQTAEKVRHKGKACYNTPVHREYESKGVWAAVKAAAAASGLAALRAGPDTREGKKGMGTDVAHGAEAALEANPTLDVVAIIQRAIADTPPQEDDSARPTPHGDGGSPTPAAHGSPTPD